MSIIIVTPVLRGFALLRPGPAGMKEKGLLVMAELLIEMIFYTGCFRQRPEFVRVVIAENETAF